MDYQAILARVLATVDDKAYLTPAAHIDDHNRDALVVVQKKLQEKETSAAEIRLLIESLFREGQLDEVHYLSALHVVAASPKVADYREAARLVAEQEVVALELGGPNLNENLASVDRHRGVLSFLQGHYEIALDYFTRSLERQRSPENIGNILCALIRLGEEDEARALLNQLSTGLSAPFLHALYQRIQQDPDLVNLRHEVD